MSDDLQWLRSMYGGQPIKKEVEDQSPTKNANRVAAGIKASKTHMVYVDIDGTTHQIATAKYVQALEQRIATQQQQLRELQRVVDKLSKKSGSLVDRLNHTLNRVGKTESTIESINQFMRRMGWR